MRLQEVFKNKPIRIIKEGGNLELPSGEAADTINLKLHDRGYVTGILTKLLASINAAYAKMYKTPLWDPKLLQSREFLSGSSLHFFNPNISDEEFTKVKPKVGDIDTQVDKHKEENLEAFLQKAQGKQVGPAKFLGFKRGNEQFSSLWELKELPIKVQIDLEFVGYEDGKPTPWAQFSHSSDWDDIKAGVKGVFHKYLIQSFATLTKQDFILRKMAGRGKARALTDVPTTDNMISFAVASKEGGGLRQKYEPVIDPDTGVQAQVDGKLVYEARPTAGYDQSLASIFSKIFGKRLTPEIWDKMSKKFWSFKGLLDVMDVLLEDSEKHRVVESFTDKLFAKGAQGLYKGDPERDADEKMIALKLMLEALDMPPPDGLNQKIADYKSSYKIDEGIFEAEAPSYARKGIKHISMPGSSAEMKDAEFLDFVNEIHKNGGTLDNIPISLKVDGAGIRFGRDDAGRPFLMTSKVTTPMYADNIGDFERYGRETGQTEEQLARTKLYDQALKTIVTSDFVKKLPKDTIVVAEMLFNPMAEKTPQGLKFVNIPYDPKKLGTTMTLVPISVMKYSTGEPADNAEQVQKALISSSTPEIKIMGGKLEHSKIDLKKIVDPIVKAEPELRTALASRKRNDPAKAQAKELLAQAREAIQSAILKSKNIKGLDALGKKFEGFVISMPNGIMAKVTSPDMKAAMAAKKAKAAPRTGGNRTKPAVVTIGSFAGHKGHQFLIDKVIQLAKKAGGDPYIYISSKVGPDDPIPPDVKVQTWKKLYPEYADAFQLIVSPDGTSAPNPLKKIEKELVLPATSPYNKIILLVGSDRYAGFKKAIETLEKRMKDPVALAKFGGTQDQVDFEVIEVPRGVEKGGITQSFTALRDVLKDPNASEEDKLKVWSQGFDVQKLGLPYIKKLMDITAKGMGINEMRIYEISDNDDDIEIEDLIATDSKRVKDAIISGNLSEFDDAFAGLMEWLWSEKSVAKAISKQLNPNDPKEKQQIIKFLLTMVKDFQDDDRVRVPTLINAIKLHKVKWPELKTIEHSVKSFLKEWGDEWDEDYGQSEYLNKLLNDLNAGDAEGFEYYYQAVLEEISEASLIRSIANHIDPESPEVKTHLMKLLLNIMKSGESPQAIKGLIEAIRWHVDWPELAVIEKSLKADTLTEGKYGKPHTHIEAIYGKSQKIPNTKVIKLGVNRPYLIVDIDDPRPAVEPDYDLIASIKDQIPLLFNQINQLKNDYYSKSNANQTYKDFEKLETNIRKINAKIRELRDTPKHKLVDQSNKLKEDKIKGADGKACWKGYRYAGTVKGKDKCIPVKRSQSMSEEFMTVIKEDKYDIATQVENMQFAMNESDVGSFEWAYDNLLNYWDDDKIIKSILKEMKRMGKTDLIKFLLTMIKESEVKNGEYTYLPAVMQAVEKTKFDWPELNTIKNSLKAAGTLKEDYDYN